jgi:GNAT superfamily N-acetyltransferase
VTRQFVPVTLDLLADLPRRCRACVFWELDPAAGRLAVDSGSAALEKEAWVSDTLLEWGTCGQIAYVDRTPVGYALYAPAAYVPRAAAFPTSPASADAVVLMAARVEPAHTAAGIGRGLVQAVAHDVARRGVRAVEAFGSTEPADCLAPAGFLRAVGFATVRDHARTPRLRLDLRSTATLRAEVEQAISRFRGSLAVPAPSR